MIGSEQLEVMERKIETYRTRRVRVRESAEERCLRLERLESTSRINLDAARERNTISQVIQSMASDGRGAHAIARVMEEKHGIKMDETAIRMRISRMRRTGLIPPKG